MSFAFDDPACRVPLVVDLDGTLLRSNLVIESLLLLAKRQPSRLPAAILWFAKGAAYFKWRLAREVTLDIATLPFNHDLVARLKAEKLAGRELIMASDSTESVAKDIANYLCLFDRVFASDGRINLFGKAKRDRLVEEFHLHGFDYLGNGSQGRIVCVAARSANFTQTVSADLSETGDVSPAAVKFPAGMAPYLDALRPRQWLKNALVFAPFALDYRFHDLKILMLAALAFVAFSLCASSGYLLNDLLDLPNDRRHPHKKDRPLASGRVSAMYAIIAIPLLLLGGIAIALLLPWPFLAALTGYYALSLTYSFRLKDIVILDVLALSVLYALRMVSGAITIGVAISVWWLAFCMFLFFSLALIKRYAELVVVCKDESRTAHARGYLCGDRELLSALGVASGFLATLVLGLHIGSHSSYEVFSLYQLFWLDCVLLLYWITHMWLMAHRGLMDDDPLVFGLRDHVSRILIVLMVGDCLAATFFDFRLSPQIGS